MDSFLRLRELMDSAVREETRMNIAQDFLDRAGISKRPIDSQGITININPIEADVLTTALKKTAEGAAALDKRDPTNSSAELNLQHGYAGTSTPKH